MLCTDYIGRVWSRAEHYKARGAHSIRRNIRHMTEHIHAPKALREKRGKVRQNASLFALIITTATASKNQQRQRASPFRWSRPQPERAGQGDVPDSEGRDSAPLTGSRGAPLPSKCRLCTLLPPGSPRRYTAHRKERHQRRAPDKSKHHTPSRAQKRRNKHERHHRENKTHDGNGLHSVCARHQTRRTDPAPYLQQHGGRLVQRSTRRVVWIGTRR